MTNSVQVPIQITAYDIAQSLGIVYIVRDLASMDPYETAYPMRCFFCRVPQEDSHDQGCVWNRAREIVDSGVLDGKS